MPETSSFSDPAARRRLPGAARLGAAVLFALVLVAGAAACGSDDGDAASTDDGATTTVTAPAQGEGQAVERFNDPTATVEVPVGQTFQITLTPDPAECFSWDLTTTDSDVVTLVTSRPSAITGTNDSPALGGAADLDVFEFTADEAGSVDLSFQEISPCEPGDVRDTRTVSVSVVEAD